MVKIVSTKHLHGSVAEYLRDYAELPGVYDDCSDGSTDDVVMSDFDPEPLDTASFGKPSKRREVL